MGAEMIPLIMGAGKKFGSGMGMLASKLFGGSPYSDYANDLGPIEEELKKYTEKGAGYLDPFYKTGIGAMGKYSGALDEMQDPTAFYSKLMSGYSESPAAAFEREQGLKDIGSDAATKGLLGSTAEGRNIAKFSQGLTAEDQQRFLNNLMKIHGQYMGGEAGLMGQGFGAGQDIGRMYTSLGGEEAELEQAAAQARAAQEASDKSGWGKLAGYLFGA